MGLFKQSIGDGSRNHEVSNCQNDIMPLDALHRAVFLFMGEGAVFIYVTIRDLMECWRGDGVHTVCTRGDELCWRER